MDKQPSDDPFTDRTVPNGSDPQLPSDTFRPKQPDKSIEAVDRYLEMLDSPPDTTHSRMLISDGIALPPPESFTEESVHEKLWEIIRGLAKRRVFLYSTDHLSDLEFYRLLWEDTMNVPTNALDESMGDCAQHIDFVSDGSEESTWLHHRYYADETSRAFWREQFPDDPPLPDRIDPPYDRDRHLPKRPGPN